MSDPESNVCVDDLEKFLREQYLQQTPEEITKWIESEIIVCSSRPTPSMILFCEDVRKVLLEFISKRNFEAVGTLWKAIVGKEFRAEDGACPVRTALFRSKVCHIMATLIIMAEEQPRYATAFREQLGKFLRTAIHEHQYVENPVWTAKLQETCRKALVHVGFKDSDNDLLKIFDQVQEGSSLHDSAKPEESEKSGESSSRKAPEVASAPIVYCAKHQGLLLSLRTVLGARRPSASGQAEEPPAGAQLRMPRDHHRPFQGGETEGPSDLRDQDAAGPSRQP